MKQVLVLHGPNLNLLGQRETNHYGKVPLSAINDDLGALANSLKLSLSTFQSHSESALITRIHQAFEQKCDFIIFNPAAYTHTSVALRDALLAVKIPFLEVHLSNLHQREVFRHHSYFSDIAVGVISGLGPKGYLLALEAAHHIMETT